MSIARVVITVLDLLVTGFWHDGGGFRHLL
jgi:hypothetical protein